MNSLSVILAVIWTPPPDISAVDAAQFLSAIRGNEPALVASLLEQNPELLTVRYRDFLRESPLHVAVTNRNLSILTTLLMHCDQPTVFDYDGMTPLHHAALQNQTAHLKLLLQFGADPNPVFRTCHRHNGDRIAACPLSLAAMRGSVEAVQTLLEHGADPSGVFPKLVIGTPAIRACHPLWSSQSQRESNPGNIRVLKLLQDAGADLNGQDTFGNFPLRNAVKKLRVDVVRALLELNVNVNQTDRAGRPALFTLLGSGAVVKTDTEEKRAQAAEIGVMLINAGAKTTIRGKYGKNAEEIAKLTGREWLLRHVLSQENLEKQSRK